MRRLIVFLLLGVFSSLCLSAELYALQDKQANIERYLLKFESDNLQQNALLLVVVQIN